MELLGFHTNFEVINGTVRNMLGTMVCHINALPVPMLRQVSVWTLKSMKNSRVFVCFRYPEHSVTLFWSLEVSLDFQK